MVGVIDRQGGRGMDHMVHNAKRAGGWSGRRARSYSGMRLECSLVASEPRGAA